MGRSLLLLLSAGVLLSFLALIDHERRDLLAEGLEPAAPGIVDDQIRTAMRALLDYAPRERPLGTLAAAAPASPDSPQLLAVTLTIPRAVGSKRAPLSKGPIPISEPHLAIELAVLRLREPWFEKGDPDYDHPLFVWTRLLPSGAPGIVIEDPSHHTPVFYRIPAPVLRHYDREIWVRLGECLRDAQIASSQGILVSLHRSRAIELAAGRRWSIQAHDDGSIDLTPIPSVPGGT